MPQQPVVGAEIAASSYLVTPTAARAALNRLEEAGVLVPTRVGRLRNREWISNELFELLDAFEHDLGEAGNERTRRARPSPTRPRRRQASAG